MTTTSSQFSTPDQHYRQAPFHHEVDVAGADYGVAPTTTVVTSSAPRHSISTTRTSTTKMYPATQIYFKNRYHKHFSCGAITLSLISLALYIAALATPAYYATTMGSNTGIGPFYGCTRDGSGNRNCDNIDSECRFERNGATSTFGIPDCSMWNALRALMVVAAGMAILGIVWMIFSIISIRFFQLSMLSNFLGGLAGATVMTLGLIYYYRHVRNDVGRYTAGDDLELGYGFILATIAWPLQMFAACCFGRSVYY